MGGLPFPVNELIPGTKYRFLRVLGEGGQGIVVLANDDFLQVEVVIKLVHAELAEQLGGRVVEEARALARINHPNIVRVKDGGITAERNPRPYFVMERLHGDTLYAVRRRMGRPFPVRDAINIAIELLDGLDVAHNPPHEMVHRDIKPGNVFMARISPHETRAVLLDFGVARLLAKGNQTMRTFVGTWQYASPEQLTDGAVSTRSDLYNVGLILYELIANRHPFAPFAQTPKEYALAHVNRVPPRLSSLGEINATLDDIVAAALAKDPQKRPRNAHEFGLMLRGLRTSLDMTHATEAPAATVEEPLQRIMERLGQAPEVATEAGRPPSTPLWGSKVTHTDPRAPANSDPRQPLPRRTPLPATEPIPQGSFAELEPRVIPTPVRSSPAAPAVERTLESRFSNGRARSASQGAPTPSAVVVESTPPVRRLVLRGRAGILLGAVGGLFVLVTVVVAMARMTSTSAPAGAVSSSAPLPALLPPPAPTPSASIVATVAPPATTTPAPVVAFVPTASAKPIVASPTSPRPSTPAASATAARRPGSGLDGPTPAKGDPDFDQSSRIMLNQ